MQRWSGDLGLVRKMMLYLAWAVTATGIGWAVWWWGTGRIPPYWMSAVFLGRAAALLLVGTSRATDCVSTSSYVMVWRADRVVYVQWNRVLGVQIMERSLGTDDLPIEWKPHGKEGMGLLSIKQRRKAAVDESECPLAVPGGEVDWLPEEIIERTRWGTGVET